MEALSGIVLGGGRIAISAEAGSFCCSPAAGIIDSIDASISRWLSTREASGSMTAISVFLALAIPTIVLLRESKKLTPAVLTCSNLSLILLGYLILEPL